MKDYSEASIVVLTESFNNWNQSQFIFGKEGDEWICRIDLEPGKHAYKFMSLETGYSIPITQTPKTMTMA